MVQHQLDWSSYFLYFRMKKFFKLFQLSLIFGLLYFLFVIWSIWKDDSDSELGSFRFLDSSVEDDDGRVDAVDFKKRCEILRPIEGLDTRRFHYFSPKHYQKYRQQLFENSGIGNDKGKFIGGGLLWCHPQKVASTTLFKFFLQLLGVQVNLNGEDITSENDTIVTQLHDQLRLNYGGLNMSDIKNLTQTAEIKLLLVRDPFERILSAFRDKLEDLERDLKFRDSYYYNLYGKFMVREKSDPARAPNWNEFISYLIQNEPTRFDEHWMPITLLCSPCSIKYDYIIKLENFQTQIHIPLEKVGISLTHIQMLESERLHRTGSGNLKTIQQYFSKLSLVELVKLHEIYKADFELFGYNAEKYYDL